MKKRIIAVLASCIFLFTMFLANAQETNLTGKVTQSDGEPMPGVTVVVLGTTIGTVTNFDGEYSLTGFPSDAIIKFSFVGMKSQEIPVVGKSSIDVILEKDAIGLEEVVAIGYGTVKKSDLTGSVASVKSDVINSFPNTTLTQAMQGRSAGVHVLQNTGSPGATIQVRIRGTNSIRGSNEPLWVIDGFPGDQNMLNPSDIESIEVLKDASATAIYGSRGANGVVIVTTKRGQKGNTRVDYEGSYTVQTLRKKLDLMNAKEYAQFYNIQQFNDTGNEYFTESEINNFGEGTDWQDLIFREAPLNSHALTVSGGNDKTQFSIGGSYYDQEGIIKNSSYQRITLRSSVNHDISQKFSIAYNVILSKADSNTKNSNGGNRGGSLIGAIVSAPPTTTPYNDDETYRLLTTVYPFSGNAILNPVAYVNEASGLGTINRVNANVAFTFKPIQDLAIKISGNVKNDDRRNDSYTTLKYPGSSGSAGVSTSNGLNVNSDNIVTYNKTFNDHSLTATAAYTYEQYTYKSLGASGTGFLSDAYETYNLGAASTLNTPSSGYSKWVLMSYLGRINYSYKNKYLATASFRADGSSRYSKGNKWGYFPSGALAWRISEENFMKDIALIDDLKLRVSYGESGSTAISPYSTLDMLGSGKTVFGEELYTYFRSSSTYPGDLKWETTSQTNFGFDFTILDQKLRMTAEYYIKNTRDLLNSVQLARSTGYASTLKNIGKIQNRGFEFQVDASLIDQKFKWDISANLAFNKNEIIKLYEGQDITGSSYYLGVVGDYVNLLSEGHPLGAFYGYKTIEGYTEDGTYAYEDLDGSGDVSVGDKTFIGDPNPDFIYGFTSNMSYKNFDLSIFIQGTYGNDIFSFSMINQTQDYGFALNTLKEVLYDHWTPENTNAKYPYISSSTHPLMSDRFVYDGSYLRLKNIELAYNFPVDKFGINWLKRGQIFVSGQNLLTLTSYPWWDPDVNSQGGSTSINQGIDYYTYPTAKSITFGIKLGF